MSNYLQKQAAYNRLMKIASAAAIVRRHRALRKQALDLKSLALSDGGLAGIGGLAGAGVGGGLGYLFGGKDNKLLSTLVGATGGGAIGAGAGYLGSDAIRKGLGKLKKKDNPVEVVKEPLPVAEAEEVVPAATTPAPMVQIGEDLPLDPTAIEEMKQGYIQALRTLYGSSNPQGPAQGEKILSQLYESNPQLAAEVSIGLQGAPGFYDPNRD